ncbi:MAG: MerC domain-containing protein [Acidobacteriia bacterium]|nr:MerC domain-containing protein [Terriglobia bacterium]
MQSHLHKPIVSSRGDRAGIVIASLCFAHCVAGPALLAFAGFASLIRASERSEIAFLLASGAMGAAALVPAYRKRHGRLSCLAMFSGGLLVMLFRSHLATRAASAEPVVAFLGAGMIISAHVLNLKFSRRCACCQQSGQNLETHRG